MINQIKVLLCCLLITPLFAITGCSKNPVDLTNAGYQDTSAIFICRLWGFRNGISFGQANLYSDPQADVIVSSVVMKWGNHIVHWGQYTAPEGVIFQWEPDTSFHGFGDTLIKIVMSSDIGSDSGFIRIPHDFTISTPQLGDTVTMNSVLPFIWSTSEYADWYQFSFWATGYDTVTHNYHRIDIYKAVTDTVFNMPTSYCSPNVQLYEGHFTVTPYSGMKPTAGVTGNMHGTVKGFLIGQMEHHYSDFYIQQ